MTHKIQKLIIRMDPEYLAIWRSGWRGDRFLQALHSLGQSGKAAKVVLNLGEGVNDWMLGQVVPNIQGLRNLYGWE